MPKVRVMDTKVKENPVTELPSPGEVCHLKRADLHMLYGNLSASSEFQGASYICLKHLKILVIINHNRN